MLTDSLNMQASQLSLLFPATPVYKPRSECIPLVAWAHFTQYGKP